MNIRIINKNENQWLAVGIGVSRCISLSMIIAWQQRSAKAGEIVPSESLKKEATIIKPGGNKSMNDLSLAFKTEERVFFSPCRISEWLELIAIT